MEDKLKYILNEEKRKLREKYKYQTLNSYSHKKINRYDSAVFYMQNKKIVGLKEQPPIKNIEFEAPSSNISPQKFQGKNLPKFKAKLLHLSRSNISLNKIHMIKNIFVFNKVKSKNILIKNKILKPFNATVHNNFKELEKFTFPNSFSNSKNPKALQINFSNKNSQTEKPEIIKLETKKIKKGQVPLSEPKEELLKDRLPINTLKYYHPKLFRHNKKFQRRKIEDNNEQVEETKNNNKNDKQSNDSCGTTQNNDNITIKYEMMEFNNKKNYVADNIQRRNKNSSLYFNKQKDKQDFHFIMKHPYSNNNFCGNLYSHMTYYNSNSYINDYSERFQNLNNPLNDVDLIRKLHNLILNPNTSKIRNIDLLLTYKNFPKGTFYGNKSNSNDKIIDMELKKLEKTKYGKFVSKLNKTMQKAKEIQKELDEELYINKNNL